jgi:hypothetical protein
LLFVEENLLILLISKRSLASRTRRCPGASTLMAEVDGGTRMPETASLYVKFKHEKRIPSPRSIEVGPILIQ